MLSISQLAALVQLGIFATAQSGTAGGGGGGRYLDLNFRTLTTRNSIEKRVVAWLGSLAIFVSGVQASQLATPLVFSACTQHIHIFPACRYLKPLAWCYLCYSDAPSFVTPLIAVPSDNPLPPWLFLLTPEWHFLPPALECFLIFFTRTFFAFKPFWCPWKTCPGVPPKYRGWPLRYRPSLVR